MSDLDHVDFYWKNDQLDVDAVLRPGRYTPFCPSIFNDFHMGSMAGNQILVADEREKETSPLPTNPDSERQTQPPVFMTSHPFGTKIENAPDYDYRNLFEPPFLLLLCLYFNMNHN